MSAGWWRKSSIAFGMKRWMRKIVNSGSGAACALATQIEREQSLSFGSDRKEFSKQGFGLTQAFVGEDDGFSFANGVRDHSLCMEALHRGPTEGFPGARARVTPEV